MKKIIIIALIVFSANMYKSYSQDTCMSKHKYIDEQIQNNAIKTVNISQKYNLDIFLKENKKLRIKNKILISSIISTLLVHLVFIKKD